MIDTNVSYIEGLPKWQLVSHLTIDSRSSFEQILVDWLIETLQILSLKPVQLQRINEGMAQALNRAGRGLQQVEHPNPVYIRIWSSQAPLNESGWGFFIVEKREIKGQLAKGENAYVVELYLYQE